MSLLLAAQELLSQAGGGEERSVSARGFKFYSGTPLIQDYMIFKLKHCKCML